MENLMEKKNYDLTQITRLLLEMRDNCVPGHDYASYDDPKRMEKYDALEAAIDLINNPSQLVTGETRDGYHTFNELYHHRAVLFSVIVRDHMEWCWKAKKHADGTMYDGMFIVGIDTPYGQASYHYNIDPYWDMFHCEEYEFAPEWDGHTPEQAIERIGKLDLGMAMFGEWQLIHEPGWKDRFRCHCGYEYMAYLGAYHHCPGCGSRMKTVFG